ncbi:MAG: hypothetical protein C4518_02985 [Desulfobacteraceae bacterium]|nr:MAG: hypothetical protein C4518_02985 [Desulfobacteraceae bacterium]
MNLEKLKKAADRFLKRYPGGFNHPEMVAIGKKHKMDAMTLFSQEAFSKEKFDSSETVIENMIKLISRASMISVFEKPKFRDFANTLMSPDRELLAIGLEERLYGDGKKGFEIMLEILQGGKLAKWPLMTICPVYYYPQKDVFVKPTTAKGVIEFFELRSLHYKPGPTWAFYHEYRKIISEMKAAVDPSLSPNNAAFTGFLMMSLENR